MTSLKIVSIVKVVPCSVCLKKRDMTYLDAVLQHVKSEQGRYLQCVGKTRVSVNTYVNVCNVIRH